MCLVLFFGNFVLVIIVNIFVNNFKILRIIIRFLSLLIIFMKFSL